MRLAVPSHVEEDQAAAHKPPRTLVVLLVLVAAAAGFSYLSAYAFVDALLAAEVVKRWPPGTDPRPRWMAVTFAGLLAAFLAVGVAARTLSARDLRRIDRMGEEA